MTKNWDDVWQVIRELYVNQGKSLEEVRRSLIRDWNFDASVRAYRLKIKEWGFQRRAASRKGRFGLQSASTEAHNLASASETSDDALRSTLGTPCSKCGTLVPNLQELFQAVCTDSIAGAEAFLASASCKCCINTPLPDNLFLKSSLKGGRYYGYRYDQPLHIAAALSSVQILQLLIEYGAEIDARGSLSTRPLHCAIYCSRPLAVEALLLHGAAASQETGDFYSPLYIAAVIRPSPSIVKLLIEHGADVNERSDRGRLLLQEVSYSKSGQEFREPSYKISKILLESGASIVSNLCLRGDPFAELLRPWQSKAFWYRSLSEAALSYLATFIRRGAFIEESFESVSCKERRFVTLLHEILFHTPGSGLAKMLVDNAEVSSNGNGANILHTILKPCPGRHIAPSDPSISFLVARLLSRGANPNEFDTHGYTPLTSMLHHLPDEELSDCLDALLEDNRTDPRLVDKRGQYPINIALRGFEDPLRLRIAGKLLSKYEGIHSSTWFLENYLPIDASYWRYTKSTPFWKAVLEYLPIDIAEAFATAAFSVSTKKFLDSASKNSISIDDLKSTLDVVNLRASYGLDEHKVSLLPLAGRPGVTSRLASIAEAPLGGPLQSSLHS